MWSSLSCEQQKLIRSSLSIFALIQPFMLSFFSVSFVFLLSCDFHLFGLFLLPLSLQLSLYDSIIPISLSFAVGQNQSMYSFSHIWLLLIFYFTSHNSLSCLPMFLLPQTVAQHSSKKQFLVAPFAHWKSQIITSSSLQNCEGKELIHVHNSFRIRSLSHHSLLFAPFLPHLLISTKSPPFTPLLPICAQGT